MIYSQGILSSMEGRNPGAAVVLLMWGLVLVGFIRGGFGVMVKRMRGWVTVYTERKRVEVVVWLVDGYVVVCRPLLVRMVFAAF